ncbi:MAG TPA: hypothetical protein PK788_13435 [Gemmatimonadaceae bacterium]|nr:hypothetical protein [Gemmatimonadaceae bacterium]HRQ78194.1 hypothetical protein [Gemmatimonadaceae bacterium]
MPSNLPTILFWSAVLAVIVGQVGILRSTQRAWRRSDGRVPVVERVFAWAPALVLVGVLYLAWGEATRPPMMEIKVDPTTREIRL